MDEPRKIGCVGGQELAPEKRPALMALDRSFRLLNVPSAPEELRPTAFSHLARQAALRPMLFFGGRCVSDPNVRSEVIPALQSRLGGADTAVFVPAMQSEEALISALQQIASASGNLYPLLHRLGVLVVCPASASNGGVLLAGGSYSDVCLRVSDRGASVFKTIQTSGRASTIDTGLRLLYEAAWLNSLPETIAQIFPKLKRLMETETEIGYETEFIPSSSASELVFQRCLSGEQLFTLLHEVYTVLSRDVYPYRPVRLSGMPREGDYLERIERRTQRIIESGQAEGGIVQSVLQARSLRVNGVLCPPLRSLLDVLRASGMWGPVIKPPRENLCHGDLILEDVLPCGAREFRLVDPNPFNHSALFDVAKTMLSLWIGYEFVYYDLFSIDEFRVTNGDEVALTINLGRPDCQESYTHAAELFVRFLRNDPRLSRLIGLSERHFEAKLRMAAAIHAVAIPMFHLLRHGRGSRAAAFLCLGLYHAARALSES